MHDTRTSVRRSFARSALLLASLAAAACDGRRADAASPTPTEDRTAALAAALRVAVDEAMATGSPGMVVAVGRGDEVVFARGYGLANLEDDVAVDVDTVFPIASITKQFTAAAILLLVEDGKVRLDDLLSRFVPEVPQAHRVTVAQALVQTAGIADYAEDPAGEPLKSVRRTPAEMATWIAGLDPPFTFEPGTSWGYSNSNYALLGLVIERASGEDYPSFLARRLFAPAGLVHTAFDDPTDIVPRRARGYRKSKTAPTGYRNADWISPTVPGPAGGLRSTAGDLLRWQAALFGGRILQPASLALMTTPGRLADGRTTRTAMPAAMQAAWGSDYAMGVLVGSPDGRERIWHSGDIDGFSTWAAYYPAERIGIVILQNSQSAERNDAAIERIVLDALTTARTGSPDRAPQAPH